MKLINTLILCGLLFTSCLPSYKKQVDTTANIFKTDEVVHASIIDSSVNNSVLFRESNGAVYIVSYKISYEEGSDTNNFIKSMIFPPFICK